MSDQPSPNSSNIGDQNQNTVVLQGNTVQGNITITQITGKSAEYKEITDRIAKLEKDLGRIPENALEWRLEVSQALETARKQERDFRDGVLRLAETFGKIEINTERLKAAKKHFDNGRLREASAILDAEALTNDQDKLLDAKQRKEQELQALDEQLQHNADEWLVKAHITALQYDLPGWSDLAISYFEQSMRAKVSFQNTSDFADFLYQQNQFQLVKPLYEKALAQADTEPEQATVLNNLGNLLKANQSFQEAEDAYQKALEIRRTLAAKDSDAFLPTVAASLNNLGNLHYANQSFDEAKKNYQEALEIRKALALKDPDNFLPHVAASLNNLGNLRFANQSFDQAKAYFQEALGIRRALAEKDNNTYLPQVAATLNNLGNLLKANQSFSEAEKAYRESLKIRKELAEKNPDAFLPQVAASLNNLGLLLSANKSHGEAEDAYQKALEIRRALAEKNPDAFLPYVAATLNNLGVLQFANKSYTDAEKAYREALKIREALAKKNPDAFLSDKAESLNNLGNLLKANQSFSEAEDAYRKSLEIRRGLAAHNPDAFLPHVATSLNNLGLLLSANQALDEAKECYREALEIRRGLAEKNSDAFLPYVAATLNNLGLLLSANKSYGEAEKAYQEALKINESLLLKHPENNALKSQLSSRYGNLAWHYLLANQPKQALEAAKNGLKIDPSAEKINGNIALANLFLDNWEAAKTIYLTWKGKPFDKARNWTAVFLEDIELLEKAGVAHPNLAKARALLKE